MQIEKKEITIEAGTNIKMVCEEPIPSIVVDGFQGLSNTGSTIRINLVEDKFDSLKQEIVRHVVLRLVFPINQFDNFIDTLSSIRDGLKQPQTEKNKNE